MLARIAAGLPALPAGGTGIVSVHDVVEAAVRLGFASATDERYILVEENISDAELFTFIAAEMQVKIGKRIAPKFLLVSLYLFEALKELLTGKRASITRELLRNYTSFKKFNGNKIVGVQGFQYSDVRQAIREAISYKK
jgi:nucleoside-diphosphate-sugar epimerase